MINTDNVCTNNTYDLVTRIEALYTCYTKINKKYIVVCRDMIHTIQKYE